MNCLDEKNPLLGMVALSTQLQMPILAGSLLRVSCLIPVTLHCTLPHSPSSYQYSITMHTDDINMPESSSVGHMTHCLYNIQENLNQ
jgi:hypothetical protein